MTGARTRLFSVEQVDLNLERARLRGTLRVIFLLGGWQAVEKALGEELGSLSAEYRTHLGWEGYIR